MFISHLGEVMGFLPLAAGNVRSDDPVALYRESPLFRELRDPEALKGECGRCEFHEVCGGSRARAFAVTGDLPVQLYSGNSHRVFLPVRSVCCENASRRSRWLRRAATL